MENHRRASYKKGLDASEGRRRREETTLQIRKSKKEEQLAKRRAASTSNNKPVLATNNNTGVNKSTASPVLAPLAATLQTIAQASTVDFQTLFQAVQNLRRHLSAETGAPVKEVVESGVLVQLGKLLTLGDQRELLFETLWALTNVASSAYTRDLVEADAVPAILKCMMHSDALVREQAIWCTGNISGDSPELRDKVLNLGAMQSLQMNLKNPAHDSLMNNATWTLSNLLRGKPEPDLKYVVEAIPYLGEMLANPRTRDVLVDAAWGISYASDGPNERIAVIMEHPIIVKKLVDLLNHTSTAVVAPAVRCLGNFVTGTEFQTQRVLNAGILKHVKRILLSPKKMLQKDMCWLLSNIAAGTNDQVQTLFTRQACLGMVVQKAQDAPWEVRKEAIWTLCNIFTGGNDHQLDTLVRMGGLEAICNTMTVADTKITMEVLSSLEHILKVGEQQGKNYKVIMDECDGIENLEKLQEHTNDEIYQRVVKIIDKYFGVEDEVEDENLMPDVDENEFKFGIHSRKLFDDNLSMDSEVQQPQQPFQPCFNFGNSISE